MALLMVSASGMCGIPPWRVLEAAAQEISPADTSAAWLPPAWLPPAIEDVAEPDRLEADPLRGAASVRLERREERLRLRRVAANGRTKSSSAGIACLARDHGPSWISAVAVKRGGPRAAASGAAGAAAGLGALVIRGAPPLFATAMGWSWTARRPASAVVAAPTFEAPPSPASAAVLGAALSAGARSTAFWAVAGRREADRARLAAAGLTAEPRESMAFGVALGVARPPGTSGAPAAGAGTERSASVSIRAGDRSRSLATELLLERGRAPTASVEALATRGPLGVASRWRRRPGEARPVAAEWIATARGARGAARVTWRPWTSRARGDDGTLEAEGAWRAPGLGPARLRIGWRQGGEDPASARERYALLDLVIAAERGRSLALLASRRERRADGPAASGATIGGRFALAARGRAALTLVIESARTGSAAGAAWTTGLTPSGESALVTRGRSSVAVSARGWVRIGAMRLRALLRDASGAGAGDAPVQATMWLEWSG